MEQKTTAISCKPTISFSNPTYLGTAVLWENFEIKLCLQSLLFDIVFKEHNCYCHLVGKLEIATISSTVHSLFSNKLHIQYVSWLNYLSRGKQTIWCQWRVFSYFHLGKKPHCLCLFSALICLVITSPLNVFATLTWHKHCCLLLHYITMILSFINMDHQMSHKPTSHTANISTFLSSSLCEKYSSNKAFFPCTDLNSSVSHRFRDSCYSGFSFSHTRK